MIEMGTCIHTCPQPALISTLDIYKSSVLPSVSLRIYAPRGIRFMVKLGVLLMSKVTNEHLV